MNRANVLWAHAVRTLDTTGLPEVWAGPALDGVRTYVEQLRRTGQYVTPELRAIVLTGLQTDGRRAHLTTSETWFQQLRWWPSGAVVFEELQRVSNLYEMEHRDGRWVVVRNEVRPGSTPIPLPPRPAPPCIAIFPPPPGCGGTDAPAASVTVTADKEVYRPGESRTETFTFDRPGRYRLIVRATVEGSTDGRVVVASDPFTVAVD
jgi:surface-anchored protein